MKHEKSFVVALAAMEYLHEFILAVCKIETIWFGSLTWYSRWMNK